jgi:hypothetical protein
MISREVDEMNELTTVAVEHRMIELPILPWMVEKAKHDANDLGLLRNSITDGEGNVAGFIGENLVCGYYTGLGLPVSQANTYDYDLVIGKTTVDVKTKRRTVPPMPHYNATVAAANIAQQCQVYMFVSILTDFSKGWLCGWEIKEKFFKAATPARKGDIDPSGNGWRFKADCYNLELSKLQPNRGASGG